MASSITLCYTPTHTSIRCRLKLVTFCTFSGRLDAADFVIKWIEVRTVQWPEIWKFIQVSYLVALSDWRQRIMHRMSGRHNLRKR